MDVAPTPPIIFDPVFFELLNDRKMLALSLLAYEAASASFYKQNPAQFREALKNPLESYLYAMDSLYLQAIFLDVVAKKSKKVPSNLENLIRLSNKEDHLFTASQMIYGKDMHLAYHMVDI